MVCEEHAAHAKPPSVCEPASVPPFPPESTLASSDPAQWTGTSGQLQTPLMHCAVSDEVVPQISHWICGAVPVQPPFVPLLLPDPLPPELEPPSDSPEVFPVLELLHAIAASVATLKPQTRNVRAFMGRNTRS